MSPSDEQLVALWRQWTGPRSEIRRRLRNLIESFDAEPEQYRACPQALLVMRQAKQLLARFEADDPTFAAVDKRLDSL